MAGRSTTKRTKARGGAPKLPAWRALSRLQLAAVLGVQPDTVSDYTARGMPVWWKGGAGKRSVYDVVACIAWWREHVAQAGAASPDRSTKDSAQADMYRNKALLDELKLKRELGNMLPLDEQILANQAIVKAWTTQLRALPRQLTQHGLIERHQESHVLTVLAALLEEIRNFRGVADVDAAAERLAS